MMQMPVASVSDHKKRDRYIAVAPLDPLIVVNVTGQHEIGHSTRRVDGLGELLGHLRAAAVMVVKRVNGMVQRHHQRLVCRRRSHFLVKPVTLIGVNAAVFGHIGVQPDEIGERSIENIAIRPVSRDSG